MIRFPAPVTPSSLLGWFSDTGAHGITGHLIVIGIYAIAGIIVAIAGSIAT